MKYRRVGSSGLSVSEVGYGNWLTHGSQVDEDTSVRCVHAALEAGITLFDTADVNAGGRGEHILGHALGKTHRDSVVISTKVYYPHPPYTPNDAGLGRKNVTRSAEASLNRLGTDYIDIYLAHRFDRHTPLEETLLAMADLVRQGKVLYVGFCEWTADQIARATAIAEDLQLPLIASSPHYSMLWRVIESQVVPACERAGIGQLPWAPLAQGLLTGKYRVGQPHPPGSRATDVKGGAMAVAGLLQEDVLGRIERLAEVAAEADLTLPQLAVAWVLQNPAVAGTLVGATSPEQIWENSTASGVSLDLDLLSAIDQVLGRAVQSDPRLTVSP
jgi:aryl-alcohol dehydrogenase-like predicted oxidoreductase